MVHGDAHHHKALFPILLLEFAQPRHFGLAGNAPCGPEIQGNGLAAKVLEANSFSIKIPEFEIRRVGNHVRVPNIYLWSGLLDVAWCGVLSRNSSRNTNTCKERSSKHGKHGRKIPLHSNHLWDCNLVNLLKRGPARGGPF